MNRRPVVAVQTSAAVNVCCWSFPAGGSNREMYISAPCPGIAGGASRDLALWNRLHEVECRRCCASPWSVNIDGAGWQWATLLGATVHLYVGLCWRCRRLHALVGWAATSLIWSVSCESYSKWPSAWPAGMASIWDGRRLDHVLGRKSSGTSGGRLLRWRRNCDGLRSPSSSCVRSWRTRWSRDVHNRRTRSVFSVL
jgi:hypothetical protein